MANEQTLTGIELREAVLRAAGWATFEWEAGLYGLRKPDGKPLLAYQDFTIKMAHSWVSEADAWQSAPAVESSVDAAEKWLTLPEGLYWGLETPIDSNAHAYVSILDVDAEMVEDTSGQYMNVPLARANHPSLAVAMCQAFLAWKAGA